MRFNEQTITDCQLLPRNGNSQSVFEELNYTRSAGGSIALRDLIVHHAADPDEISVMQEAISHANNHPELHSIKFTDSDILYIQQFLRMSFSLPNDPLSIARYKLFYSPQYNILRSHVSRILFFLHDLSQSVPGANEQQPSIIRNCVLAMKDSLGDRDLKFYLELDFSRLKPGMVFRIDKWFRSTYQQKFETLLTSLYRLDAINSLAIAMRKKNLVFPCVDMSPGLGIERGFNLLLGSQVNFDFRFSENKNVLFLSGANMAGKSTFFRSLGTIVCMAHAGLPVPALAANIPFYHEINICVNPGDNLSEGYSQFYNEIRQVQKYITGVQAHKRCFAIFDEIFKGTNLNDAARCSEILIRNMAHMAGSDLLISSHHIQLAGIDEESRLPVHRHVDYKFMETLMIDGKPEFTYSMRNGINEIYLGLYFFNNRTD